jgi:hypothetical protein
LLKEQFDKVRSAGVADVMEVIEHEKSARRREVFRHQRCKGVWARVYSDCKAHALSESPAFAAERRRECVSDASRKCSHVR